MGKTVVMGQVSDKNDKHVRNYTQLLASCLTTLIGIIFVLITTAYIGENLANKCYLSSAIDVHQCQSAEYLAAYDSFVSGQNAEKVQMSDKSVIDLADKLESPESDAFKVQKGEYCVNDDTCSAGARIHAFWTGEIDSTVVDFTGICDSDLIAIMKKGMLLGTLQLSMTNTSAILASLEYSALAKLPSQSAEQWTKA